MDWEIVMSKNAFCLVIQNPLALRSTRMLSCILSVLFDRLSSESESSDVSILTSLQIILNKFAVVSLTCLCLMMINLLFWHDRACLTLIFCPHAQFLGSRYNCHPYLILIISVMVFLFNKHPSLISSNKENYIKEPGLWLISSSSFWISFISTLFKLNFSEFWQFGSWVILLLTILSFQFFSDLFWITLFRRWSANKQ